MRVRYTVLTLLAALLVGCSAKEPEPELPQTPPLSTQADVWTWGDITVGGVGSLTGFLETSEGLEIHPFYDNPKHILVKRIIISEQGFWDTLCKSSDDLDVTTLDNFSIITMPSGTSYGYWEISNDKAIIFESSSLPSSYVKEVMNKTCK